MDRIIYFLLFNMYLLVFCHLKKKIRDELYSWKLKESKCTKILIFIDSKVHKVS